MHQVVNGVRQTKHPYQRIVICTIGKFKSLKIWAEK